MINAEQRRLKAHREKRANWKQWGPYLAERAWGTVREDYSRDGNAWAYFPHEHARSRVYRWNEDGLAGICDRQQYLCFSIALWNGKDPFLKERLFGLSGPEGNHGEDVKELYWYEDSTPTHSYLSMRYHYPQDAFPYSELQQINASRNFADREYELSDTGIFSDNRYFDLQVVYAKSSEDDLLISISVKNCGKHRASISVIPQLWFRNTWSWGYDNGPMKDVARKPLLSEQAHENCGSQVLAQHPVLGDYHLYWQGKPHLMMTENDTNRQKLFGTRNIQPFVKDAFHDFVVDGKSDAINPNNEGTKAGLHYELSLKAGASRTLQLRLTKKPKSRPFTGFRPTQYKREHEADDFYNSIQNPAIPAELKQIQRQALAGMLWSKQLYYYDVKQWLTGDPGNKFVRKSKRNSQWQQLHNFDIMSMPDKWEYPWYALWDTAFHTLPLAMLDTDYAKRQLLLTTREWYMHPNGQLPAYEWNFGDVNPPVHAWASWRVYKMSFSQEGVADKHFLESIFQKMSLNFTWWVNQKDNKGHSIFGGGFLGLDNISLFDRSKKPPTGGLLNQSDGTAWMGFFSHNMLAISLELSRSNRIYQDMASKYLEHYLHIASAINGDDNQAGLWDEEDGFFYDHLDLRKNKVVPIKVRSLVGLMPLIAVSTLEKKQIEAFPDFRRRMNWFMEHRPAQSENIIPQTHDDSDIQYLLSFVNEERLRRILAYLLDENEFLSNYGIRSLSKAHAEHPFSYTTDKGEIFSVGYEPGEGETDLFGGNSNWRGPIWFPINYLIIESLRTYHAFYGDAFTIECPTGSDNQLTLDAVATHIAHRLCRIFASGPDSKRAWCGDNSDLQRNSDQGLHQFFEYFNGDTGEGLGASHQTGWTGLIALLLQQSHARHNEQ